MVRTVDGSTLSFSQKFSRLGSRLKDAQWRRYGITLLGGKVLGVVSVLMVAVFLTQLLFTTVHAADAPIKAADIVNPVNTAWTLIAAFLVFRSEEHTSELQSQ